MSLHASFLPNFMPNHAEVVGAMEKILSMQQIQKQFVSAIALNNIAEMESLSKSNPELLTKVLPNGELPLQFAVQKKSLAAVTLLMQKGADPSQKDDQQLSAIDYARIHNNQDALVEMLRIVVSQDAENVKAILQSPTNLRTAKQVLNKINGEIAKLEKSKIFDYLNFAVNNLEAEYKSRKDTPSLLPFFITQSSPSSFIINRLLNDPIVQQCLGANRQTLLHVAIASGNKKLFEFCLQSKQFNANFKNLAGHSSLEYAAAKEKMDFIRLLAQEGADFRSVDPVTTLTPFALLGASAHERDPLSITKLEGFFFLSSLALWAAPLMMDKGDIKSEFYLQTALLGTHAILTVGSLYNSYGNIKTYFARNILRGVLLAVCPTQASLIVKAFNGLDLTMLTKKTFLGLRQCWRNRQINPAKALFKAVVANGPLVSSIKGRLESLGIEQIISQNYSTVQNSYAERILNCATQRPNDLERCAQLAADVSDKCFADNDSTACHEVENEFNQYWGHTSSGSNGNSYSSSSSSNATKCIKAAEVLGIDVNASRAEAGRVYRALAPKYHPDKNPEDKETMAEINNAYDIFKECKKESSEDTNDN